jgi:hypothetical protein
MTWHIAAFLRAATHTHQDTVAAQSMVAWEVYVGNSVSFFVASLVESVLYDDRQICHFGSSCLGTTADSVQTLWTQMTMPTCSACEPKSMKAAPAFSKSVSTTNYVV